MSGYESPPDLARRVQRIVSSATWGKDTLVVTKRGGDTVRGVLGVRGSVSFVLEGVPHAIPFRAVTGITNLGEVGDTDFSPERDGFRW